MSKQLLAVAAAMALLPASPVRAQDNAAILIGQGAQVYADTCARCHNARSGTERTDMEWVAIVGHMRARANLSKTRARAVLAFLQATNIPEGVPAAVPQTPQPSDTVPGPGVNPASPQGAAGPATRPQGGTRN